MSPPPPDRPVRGASRARPTVAYEQHDFLRSDDARPLRILAEYLEPLQRFRRARVHDTIVFFGSARLAPDGPMRRYYDAARELARLVTTWSKGLENHAHRYVVCTGGGGGIMEAANRGAADAAGRSIGLNIVLPHEQRPNRYVSRGLAFQFHYFFMRKLWFAHLARALVVFPGGFGTLDELSEMLMLSQTRKLGRRIPILLYGSDFWHEVLDLDALVRHGMIDREDLEFVQFVDDPQAGLEILKASLLPNGEDATPAFAHSRHVDPSGPDAEPAPS